MVENPNTLYENDFTESIALQTRIPASIIIFAREALISGRDSRKI